MYTFIKLNSYKDLIQAYNNVAVVMDDTEIFKI